MTGKAVGILDTTPREPSWAPGSGVWDVQQRANVVACAVLGHVWDVDQRYRNCERCKRWETVLPMGWRTEVCGLDKDGYTVCVKVPGFVDQSMARRMGAR